MNLFVNQLVGFCLLLSCLAGLSYLLIRFLKVPSCIAPPAFVSFNTKGSVSASVASIDAHR